MVKRYNKGILFEFNVSKSTSNKLKHGVDFERAQELWNDPDLLELDAISSQESRKLIIGKLGNKHWTAIITKRKDKIRIISVRRSRLEEVKVYENENH